MSGLRTLMMGTVWLKEGSKCADSKLSPKILAEIHNIEAHASHISEALDP